MDQVNNALELVKHWLEELLGLLIGIFAAIEVWAHDVMTRGGLPSDVQDVILLGIGIVFILAALRIFGGVIRLLLIVLLVLFLLHVVAPMSGL